MSILHSLRYSKAERFNALMRPTDHTSDTFKFHLHKLVKLGFVIKRENGEYQLTPQGKEYANSLDEQHRTIEKQPKISVVMIISKTNKQGEPTYLLQKRLRNPFYGYWSEIHGRAKWGETFEATAQRQLKRQTGLDATFAVHGFRRARDYTIDNEMLLEDKLFVILRAVKVSGELTNTYDGGTNAWLTLNELRSQENVFESTRRTIEHLDNSAFYHAQDYAYRLEQY